MTTPQPAAPRTGSPRGDAFWDGDFTLRGEETPDRAADPAPDALGPSGITVRGRDVVDLLRPAYRLFGERG